MEKETTFGIRIDQLLTINGIKPNQLCEATGIHPQQIYAWKKTGATPNVAAAYKIAQYLGTSVEYLLTGNAENPLQNKVQELQNKLKKINEIASSI